MSDSIATLPAPPTDRWRPTRAGLISMWRYWDETFTFHHGRLLLRGPNGSGKSMALELLLPFVLDGDASPAKLTSAAKQRGGLFERLMTGTDEPTRAGFAWVEFRRGEDVFTAGVRVRASASTGKADHDFFTTSQEIGRELSLLDGTRRPLTRKLLVEAIGDRGRVHGSGEEHRGAVRQALFPGFSPDRYESVITALLALRKEKLSQNLDLVKLSDVLSEALPPLDEQDLAAVAEGFERLDRRRAELVKLEDEVAQVKLLVARQREYARAVVASVAHQVTRAEYQRDNLTRVEREARAGLAAAQAEGAAARAALAALSDRLEAIEVETAALKDSAAYREGAALNDLREEARRVREQVGRAARVLEQTRSDLDAATEAGAEADRHVAEAGANLAFAVAGLREVSSVVGADAVVATAIEGEPDDGERLLGAWVRSRRDTVAAVRTAIGEHREAVQHRGFVEGQVAEAEEVVGRLETARREAADGYAAAVDAYGGAVRSWAASCGAIGPDLVAAALPEVVADPRLVTAAVARLTSSLHAETAVSRRIIETRRSLAGAERAVLVAERADLASGRLISPPGPEWRGSRDGRDGAPLWQLVDVSPELGDSGVDRLEAALTAGGLIDAWVGPDGRLDLPAGVADALFGDRSEADGSAAGGSAAGRSLADVLVPLPDAAVAATVVDRVLGTLPVADTADPDLDVVIGLDGSFRMGPLAGRGPARPAVLLGAAARERRRLDRIAELDAAIALVDATLAEVERDAEAIERRAEAIDADLALLPSGAALEAAALRVGEAIARLGQAEDTVAIARRRLVDAEDAVRSALRALTTLGSRHGLPTEEAGLAAVEEQLTRLDRAANAWARRGREAAASARERHRAGAHLARAASAASLASRDHQEVSREADAVAGRLATLESSIGADYEEVLGRISVLDSERRSAKSRHRELGERQPEIERRIGSLEAQVVETSSERERADQERTAAHERMLRLVSDGMVADAGVAALESLDGVTATVAAARALAAELDAVADGPQDLERAGARVVERVHAAHAALGGRIDVARELSDAGWWIVRAVASGLRRSAADLHAALARELEQGRLELAVDEERLFEQTLAGSVRRALAQRIRQATALVDGINSQLAAVKTAAGGVQVRLRWEVDPEEPDAVKAARGLLLRDPADLTDTERRSLQDFVRARVDQARVGAAATASWDARLRESLDYRAWHRFGLQLGHRDWEGFQPATAKRLQRLSTGERSIALHLPMLASIAAHYAEPDGTPSSCPRLILLDELFAGVDAANRAQLFGTFTSWDLDAVFTSDHEWCQYAALDGIAIHHLHPPTGDEPVTSTRFTWDGKQRTIDPAA